MEKIKSHGNTLNSHSRTRMTRVTIPQKVKLNRRFIADDIQTYSNGIMNTRS